jgi:hypothetical protein
LDKDPRPTAFVFVPAARHPEAPYGEGYAAFWPLAHEAVQVLQRLGFESPGLRPPVGQALAEPELGVRQWLGIVLGLAEAGELGHDLRPGKLSLQTPDGAALHELRDVFGASARALEALANRSQSRPSVGQLRAILEALQDLKSAFGSFDSTCAWQREDHIFVPFDRLGSARDAIGGESWVVDGWSWEVACGLTIAQGLVESLAVRWGWTHQLLPREERSALVARRKKRFEDEVERPYFQAANALRGEWKDRHVRYDDIADEGARRGYGATTSPYQARILWPQLDEAYHHTLRLGSVVPEPDAEVVSMLGKAYDFLKPQVEEAERDLSPRAQAASSQAVVETATSAVMPTGSSPAEERGKTPLPDHARDRDVDSDRDEARGRRASQLRPPSLAVAAAYELKNERLPVSVHAACRRAGIDYKHLRERYPEVVALIDRLARADRDPPPPKHRDRRSDNLDGIHRDPRSDNLDGIDEDSSDLENEDEDSSDLENED